MKYQLVLQWPASSVEDYDVMISVEDMLTQELSDGGDVEGHDEGSGQVNISILTDHPGKNGRSRKPDS